MNRQLARRGSVFADRYHARALKTPRSAQLAVRYVLLNVRKHERGAVPCGFVDPCSSAPWFTGFGRPVALVFGVRGARSEWARLSQSDAPPVAAASTWLLRVGYLRAGLFDVDDEPGRRARAAGYSAARSR